jgi:hypothetical protein
MTKLDALKNCVWLECFAINHSSNKEEFSEAIKRLAEIQKYIGKLPNDEITD